MSVIPAGEMLVIDLESYIENYQPKIWGEPIKDCCSSPYITEANAEWLEVAHKNDQATGEDEYLKKQCNIIFGKDHWYYTEATISFFQKELHLRKFRQCK